MALPFLRRAAIPAYVVLSASYCLRASWPSRPCLPTNMSNISPSPTDVLYPLQLPCFLLGSSDSSRLVSFLQACPSIAPLPHCSPDLSVTSAFSRHLPPQTCQRANSTGTAVRSVSLAQRALCDRPWPGLSPSISFVFVDFYLTQCIWSC